MKKIVLLVLSMMAIGVASYAQGSYVRLNVGYGFPIGGQQIGEDYSYGYEPEYHYTEKGIYGSYGSGITINAAYGMTLKGALGLDFELGYLIGKEYTTTYLDIDDNDLEEDATSIKGFTFAPSITFTAQEGKVLPYTRFGPVFGSFKTTYTETYTDEDGVYIEEEEYTGGFSVGFKGTIGAVFNTGGKFQFFSELNLTSMSYSPKEGEITEMSYNGESYLDDYDADELTFDFVDERNYVSGQDNDDRVKIKLPLSSLALQVGVRMKLN